MTAVGHSSNFFLWTSHGYASMTITTIRLSKLDSKSDREAFRELLDHYARQDTGAGQALSHEVLACVAERFAAHPNTLLFLAEQLPAVQQSVPGPSNSRIVGMATCIGGFSTFRAQPLINIHDLIVHGDYQRQGIGGQLIQAVRQHAIDQNYCALTLEVREDNPARRLYSSQGFTPLNPETRPHFLFAKLPLY